LISVPKAGLQYPNYTPFKLPELLEHHFVDKAIGSDPNKAELFGAATEVKHLTPAIGTELVGIQLKTLTDTQKNELARLVAERGVVFLRDQELDVYEQIAFGA
jgi:sulfonate dioxygenase